ncbi:unnamed protein product [Mortierella alpina]
MVQHRRTRLTVIRQLLGLARIVCDPDGLWRVYCVSDPLPPQLHTLAIQSPEDLLCSAQQIQIPQCREWHAEHECQGEVQRVGDHGHELVPAQDDQSHADPVRHLLLRGHHRSLGFNIRRIRSSLQLRDELLLAALGQDLQGLVEIKIVGGWERKRSAGGRIDGVDVRVDRYQVHGLNR